MESELEVSHKAKHLIYRSVCVSPLTYVQELWVVTERTRLWIRADEMRFLQRIAGLHRGRVGSSDIHRE